LGIKKKMGEAAIGVMTDIAVQLVAEKYFGNNGEGYETWDAAWNNLSIDWWQAMASGAENLIANKNLAAALSAGNNMLYYYFTTDDASWEGAVLAGGLGAFSSYIAGGITSFIVKYGARPVAKGLRKMGGFSDDLIFQLTGVKFHNFSLGTSFEGRHVARRVKNSSFARGDGKNTVALKGVDYKQDLADINDGLAEEINDQTYGVVYKLKNGNRYYNDSGNIKPLAGGGYMDLTRGAFKAL
jgi:hypothetical protein